MNDRGEKIVSLAREMLRSEFTAEPPHTALPHNMSTQVKAVCLAAFLAAFGSQLVTQSIDQARRPLNRYEKVELEALMFYASQTKSLDASTLRLDLLAQISRKNVEDMTYADFDPARDYLQSRLR